MARQVSETDARLCTALAARGRVVSGRQVERWRGAGIIRYERHWPGGGGSRSSYTSHTVDIAVALDEILEHRRKLHDAVLILYCRGFDLEPGVVRKAMATYLNALDRDLARLISQAAALGGARKILAESKSGRGFLRRLTAAGLGEASFLSVLHGLREGHAGWVAAFVVASGLRDIASDLLDDDTLAALVGLLEGLNVSELRAFASDVSAEDLGRGLDDSRVIYPFVGAFVELLARITSHADVPLPTPTDELEKELFIARGSFILAWVRTRPENIDKAARLAREQGEALTAMVDLARQFSFARGPLFGPGSTEAFTRLKGYERERVFERIRAWVTANPDAARSILAIGDSPPGISVS